MTPLPSQWAIEKAAEACQFAKDTNKEILMSLAYVIDDIRMDEREKIIACIYRAAIKPASMDKLAVAIRSMP